MTKLSLLEKPFKHAVGGMISFSRDIFDIERMIEEKMVRLSFLGYSIDTNLSFKV